MILWATKHFIKNNTTMPGPNVVRLGPTHAKTDEIVCKLKAKCERILIKHMRFPRLQLPCDLGHSYSLSFANNSGTILRWDGAQIHAEGATSSLAEKCRQSRSHSSLLRLSYGRARPEGAARPRPQPYTLVGHTKCASDTKHFAKCSRLLGGLAEQRKTTFCGQHSAQQKWVQEGNNNEPK